MIEVALQSASGESIATQRTRLRSGINQVSFIVSEAPAIASVDRSLLRIDRNRFDNEKQIAR